MTYIAQDQSVEDGQPIHLFKFFNSEETFTFTSSQEQVIFDGKTYVPTTITHSEPSVSSIETQRAISIQMPGSNVFAQRYIPTVPASPDKIIIYRFHSTDGGTPEVIVLFTGAVASVQFTGEVANVAVQARSEALGRTIPKQSSRAQCNHVLYDARCAVNDLQFRIQGLITSISADGFTIQISCGTNTSPATGNRLSEQLTADADFFNTGFIRRGGVEHRMVQTVADLGSDVVGIDILLPFQTLELGDSVDLFAGCDHSFVTCIAKFDNVDRFGGFPFIPEKNPFDVGIDN